MKFLIAFLAVFLIAGAAYSDGAAFNGVRYVPSSFENGIKWEFGAETNKEDDDRTGKNLMNEQVSDKIETQQSTIKLISVEQPIIKEIPVQEVDQNDVVGQDTVLQPYIATDDEPSSVPIPVKQYEITFTRPGAPHVSYVI